ncbi:MULTISPECIES: hypothetical protein [Frankia]|uniref:hypothetical protein n=1 Tax=Frankia TaxID=1854 RepID=UPI0006EC1943|nr:MULTISPECIES: hypothetical protein [Frankia]
MTTSLTCKHCDTTISANDEEDLVAQVQTHVQDHAAAHGRVHTVSRNHVLARLHRHNPDEEPPSA